MEQVIDIRKILKEKNPKVERWMPGFVVRYLKRILHQEEINIILNENKDLYNYEFCSQIVERFGIEFEITGIENIPRTGGVVLAINHPLGGFDALALAHVLAPFRKDVKFVTNDVLLNFKNIRDFMVGVNKHGSKSKESINSLNELFSSEKAVLIFPAGLVSRRTKGKVIDSEWKKTFIARARKFQKDIVPIHIDGELSNFFYRLSNLRKKLGVKANIEMLYLANETFKLRGRKFKVTVGEAMSHTMFDKSKSDHDWAQVVKKIVYDLS